MGRLVYVSIFMILLVATAGCDKQGATTPEYALRQAGSYDIDVEEPSGLCLAADGAGLYTVSDATNQVYLISLTGTVLATLAYTGVDLEGVAYDAVDDVLLVVEERSREIVELSTAGQELSRHVIDVPGSAPNSGLEGIAIRAADHALFVVNEKDPARLFGLAADFSVSNEYQPDAGIDYSGLCHDAITGLLWVLSDQAEEVFTWEAQTGVHDVYRLPVDKPEGIAIGTDGRVYIVSDADERLYVFEGPV